MASLFESLGPDELMARALAPVKREYLRKDHQNIKFSEDGTIKAKITTKEESSDAIATQQRQNRQAVKRAKMEVLENQVKKLEEGEDRAQGSGEDQGKPVDDGDDDSKKHAEGDDVAKGAKQDIAFDKAAAAADGKKKSGSGAKGKGLSMKALREKSTLCPTVSKSGKVESCKFGDGCKWSHNVDKYLELKPPDLDGDCPFSNKDSDFQCPFGISCRYLTSHSPGEHNEWTSGVLNGIEKDVKLSLRKGKYEYKLADPILKNMGVRLHYFGAMKRQRDDSIKAKTEEVGDMKVDHGSGNADALDLQSDNIKKIDWEGKVYLAPLTTVGNLPFRRVLVQRFGVDITVGEMAMGTNLLQGHQAEWALLKRHPCEKIFGVQICGGFPDTIARSCDLISAECSSVDFIDLNCGCPIDLVCDKGAGSSLLRKQKKLHQIISSASSVLSKRGIPFTVKMRTGYFDHENIAHELIPEIFSSGAAAVSLHGRTRQQRYSKLADWNYIKKCVASAGDKPVIGNGDIYTFEEYYNQVESSGVTTAMIARGALIKPWVATEIKERRHWDISSSERFEMLKEFATYGLEHWGSDTKGVETTRRFMLEWLSFLHRYIPIGLLERMPPKINWRPPRFFGRNDLETLLGSNSAADWVKITEMILGPPPSNFVFVPKHKSSAYENVPFENDNEMNG